MILVDSSVWIDYLSHRSSKVSSKLESLIRPVNQALITGIIYQEVLQGIKNERSFDLTKKFFGRLPFLMPNIETYQKAAEIFKSLISKGKHPRTVDVLIAVLAIQNKVPLFTLDTDFHQINTCTELELFA